MDGVYEQSWVLSGGLGSWCGPAATSRRRGIAGERSCTAQKVQKDVRTEWARTAVPAWVYGWFSLKDEPQSQGWRWPSEVKPFTFSRENPPCARRVTYAEMKLACFGYFWLTSYISHNAFWHSAAGGIFVPIGSSRVLLDAAGGTARLPPVRQGAEVHLTHDLGEQLVHHGLALGRGLHEGAAPVLGQRLALAGGHLPLVLQVHLVPHQHHRDLLVPGTKRQRNMSGEKIWSSHQLTGQPCWIMFTP